MTECKNTMVRSPVKILSVLAAFKKACELGVDAVELDVLYR